MTEALTLEQGSVLVKTKFLKYFEVSKINYFNRSAYLTNLICSAAVIVLRIWIFTQLFRASYSSAGVGSIGGLSVGAAIWSLMLTQSFSSGQRPPILVTIEEEVKSGSLAYSINRPYSYMAFHLFGFFGKTVANLMTNVTIGTVAAFFLVGPLSVTLSGLIFGVVLLFLGLLLDFFVSFFIGLLAFWLEDISALGWIYFKGKVVFGGYILPVALFPDYLRKVVELLPFSQICYAPSRLMVNFEIDLFWQYLVTQLLWISFFWALACFTFSKGIKNVSINGG